MIIFHSRKSEPLAREVAAGSKADLGKAERKVFPDGEIYVRLLTPVKGEESALIHTTRTNDDLVELVLTLSALRDNGAKTVRCVVPHMMYQRQDSAFEEGEAVSARTVLGMLDKYADEIITVNAHFLEKAGKSSFGGVEVTNLDAFPLLGAHFKGVKDCVILSPDEGSMHYAAAAAEELGCPSDYLVKKRLDGETVEMKPKELDVGDKSAIVLDDVIATGGTMMKAAEMLGKQGAKKVYLGCVHGVFAKGLDAFKAEEVICTDSLPTKASRVSLAPLVAEALER